MGFNRIIKKETLALKHIVVLKMKKSSPRNNKIKTLCVSFYSDISFSQNKQMNEHAEDKLKSNQQAEILTKSLLLLFTVTDIMWVEQICRRLFSSN